MDCPLRYRLYMGFKKHQNKCFADSRNCSFWRLGWCKGYLPLAILIIAVGLYFGIGLARAYEKTQNQIVIVGSLEEYHRAKRNAGLIGGCYGWDEKAQKYRAWDVKSEVCQK